MNLVDLYYKDAHIPYRYEDVQKGDILFVTGTTDIYRTLYSDLKIGNGYKVTRVDQCTEGASERCSDNRGPCLSRDICIRVSTERYRHNLGGYSYVPCCKIKFKNLKGIELE